MSLLKIENPVALQFLMSDDLYKVMETEMNPSESVIPETEKPNLYFEYLGENNKYTLILIDEAAYQHISPKDLELLENILKAKKHEIKDVAVLNLNKYPSANFEDLKTFFACNSIVLFGINPSRINLAEIQSNVTDLHQSTKILSTYSFSEMASSTDKKRIFWEQMKNI